LEFFKDSNRKYTENFVHEFPLQFHVFALLKNIEKYPNVKKIHPRKFTKFFKQVHEKSRQYLINFFHDNLA
jgi:hypothetical protein